MKYKDKNERQTKMNDKISKGLNIMNVERIYRYVIIGGIDIFIIKEGVK